VLKHNGIQTNQRIKFARYGSQCKHKIVFEYHSSVGGSVEKTKIFFPYYEIKINLNRFLMRMNKARPTMSGSLIKHKAYLNVYKM